MQKNEQVCIKYEQVCNLAFFGKLLGKGSIMNWSLLALQRNACSKSLLGLL